MPGLQIFHFVTASRLASGAPNTHRLSTTSIIDRIHSLAWTDVATGKL